MTGNAGKTPLPDRLRDAAETLNRESDALAQSLRETEAALNALALGIEVHLEEPILTVREMAEDKKGNPMGEYTLEYSLGYGKCLGKNKREWGIWIRTDFEGETKDFTGVAELSRELRVAASKHLHALIDLLTAEAEKVAKDVREAQAALDEAARRLNK